MATIPSVQIKRLTTERKAELLERVFEILEYDGDENPGAVVDGSALSDIQDIFARFGVKFTSPSKIPAGYRINQHHTAVGTWCAWSHCTVAEPFQRTPRGNIHCPDNCPDSIVEVDPDADRDAGRIDVDALQKALTNMGVPFRVATDGSGDHTIYIGHGEWDEATERWTHPMAAGPCRLLRGRMVAFEYEFTWGPRNTDGEQRDPTNVDDLDAEHIASQIARWYWTDAPPALTVRVDAGHTAGQTAEQYWTGQPNA